ncbi:MAG: hypothetical protein ABIJ56_19090 [Pseudomonadota bacterium]
MNRKTAFKRALTMTVLLLGLSLNLWSCGGAKWMVKPKVVIEHNDPAVSFFAALIALGRLGYVVQTADTNTGQIVTAQSSLGSHWWQMVIVVNAAGHLEIDTLSDVEQVRGGQKIMPKAIVRRAVQVSKQIQEIIYKVDSGRIIAEGTALLPPGVTVVTESAAPPPVPAPLPPAPLAPPPDPYAPPPIAPPGEGGE